jgi:xanthine/CO dehydrogenase XdhC/CoxF family maturation factor
MRELDQILDALGRAEAPVLATVVGVHGSSYRSPGARLVIPAAGHPTGTISGGCLESELIATAAQVRTSGRSQVIRFDLTSDDPTWGWGHGCNGVVDVLVEPPASALHLATILADARRHDAALAMVTVLSGDWIGRRMFVHPDGRVEGSLGSEVADGLALDAALERLAGRGSSTRQHSADAAWPGGVEVFVEAVEPPLRLVVCGAGSDAVPLVEAASLLGWRVDVLDDRPALLTTERFPQARRLVRTQPPAAAAAAGVDDRTYVVVMTHNLTRDADYLRSFLASPVPYLGMLGPAARLERMMQLLSAEGAGPVADPCRIYGPAGLDLGAEGPDEIAVAIVAEILAVQRGGGAGFLRDRPAPIRARRRAAAIRRA